MVEWKLEADGVYTARVGMLMLVVTMVSGEWVAVVVDLDTGVDCADEHVVGTLEDAQRRALELAQGLFAPLVAQAVADERKRAAAELAVLTARMEVEIPAAATAVRARTIEECAGRVGERAEQVRRIATEVSAVFGDDTGAIQELGRRAADVLDVIANALRALDTTTTTAAAEPAGAASVQPVDATAQPSAKRARSCNMHDDCDAEDERARASGRPRPAHCSSDDCEECFGK
jgi:hypothetical protein